MTRAAMVPYKRTPPPLAMRLVFASMLFAMGPMMWFLQRFKLEGSFFRRCATGRSGSCATKNPFAGYRPTGHDVFVVTYVKSGTNWMMQLAHQLALPRQGRLRAHSRVVPWPDTTLMGPLSSYAIPSRIRASGWRRPRASASSRRTSSGSDCRTRPRPSYIIVIRDPKDVFVSSYFFFVKNGPFRSTNPSVPAWLELFLSDDFFMGGSWAATTAGYWAQRDKPNVLICSFKEMRRDLDGRGAAGSPRSWAWRRPRRSFARSPSCRRSTT